MTLASDAFAIARAGIRSVDPGTAVRHTFRRSRAWLELGARRIPLSPAGRIHLIAIGKAAGAMIDAAIAVAGPGADGLAVTPRGYPPPRASIPTLYGDHPVPGRGSFRAGRRLLDHVASIPGRDAVVFLLSGGGSAVAESPAEGVSPTEVAATTRALLASGATISEMNAIRRHLSAIKGGRLALATGADRFGSIAISDVVGDAPSDIASGPTVADPSTFGDALHAVDAHHLRSRLPPGVLRYLESGDRGRRPETPKGGEPRLRRAPFVIAASNRVALAASAREARRRGYRVRTLSSWMTGETREIAERFTRTLMAARSQGRFALLGGGETTVTLARGSGRGGRNQEFALAGLAPLEGRRALVLSIGTDGIDGPTDAAGGWVDGRSAGRARARGVDVTAALGHHASYDALERIGGLVRTGPTGTNVMDLHVGLRRGR